MGLERQFLRFIGRHRMLQPGDRVGVAVSGGSDSVALLHLLVEAADALGIWLCVLHFDHRLRSDSAEAAEFVQALAVRFRLHFYCGSADIAALAAQSGTNLEQVARERRYEFFAETARAQRLTAIATGHTADDQAETVLLRLLRGTGPAGLVSIWPVLPAGGCAGAAANPARVVRPLLDTSRADLRAWLSSRGQDWMDDPTNESLQRSRNRVRLQLLPLLRRDYNPQIVKTLCDTAELARADEQYWSRLVADLAAKIWRQSANSVAAGTRELRALDLALLRRMLREGVRLAQGDLRQVDFPHLEQLAGWVIDPNAGHPGPHTSEFAGVRACVTAQQVVLYRRSEGVCRKPERGPSEGG